jgi:hypothetical protein
VGVGVGWGLRPLDNIDRFHKRKSNAIVLGLLGARSGLLAHSRLTFSLYFPVTYQSKQTRQKVWRVVH